MAAGTAASWADETPDAISRLAERSAEDRWKEARRQWLPLNLRRTRRLERQTAAAEPAPPAGSPPVIEAPSTAPANPGLTAGRHRRWVNPGLESPEPETHPDSPRPFKMAADSDPARHSVLRPRLLAPFSQPDTEKDDVPEAPVASQGSASPGDVVRHDSPPRGGAALGLGSTRTILKSPPDQTPLTRFASAPRSPEPPHVEDRWIAMQPSTPAETEVPPSPEAVPQDKPLPSEEELDLPNEPLTNAPLKLRKITEIRPVRSYSPDGTPTRLCPPSAGADLGDAGPPRCPEEHELPNYGTVERHFADLQFAWEPSNVFHNPLYFEDFVLERSGQTYGEPVQAFVSAGKFGIQLIGLPYQLALDHPCNEEYPLGHYRPGECAPRRCYQVPLNAKAAAVAAGTYTGIAFLFP